MVISWKQCNGIGAEEKRQLKAAIREEGDRNIWALTGRTVSRMEADHWEYSHC